MNKLIVLLFIIIIVLTGSLQAQEEIVGIWDAGEVHVEIRLVEYTYIGNPIDTAGVRRDEIEILNIEYDKGYWKGKLFSVKNDKLMNVECQIKDEELHLRVKAGMFRRTIEWTRVQ